MFLRLNYNRRIIDFIGVGGYGWYEEWIVEKGENFIHFTATGWKYSAQSSLCAKNSPDYFLFTVFF